MLLVVSCTSGTVVCRAVVVVGFCGMWGRLFVVALGPDAFAALSCPSAFAALTCLQWCRADVAAVSGVVVVFHWCGCCGGDASAWAGLALGPTPTVVDARFTHTLSPCLWTTLCLGCLTAELMRVSHRGFAPTHDRAVVTHQSHWRSSVVRFVC